MEKKTIGKFIAALRKANGMTQKELGERLFVSDKTVSRWECDECTPELSLIPSIAELFSVTTDELLRGERSRGAWDTASSEDAERWQKAKSEKRIKLMLHNRRKKYSNLSLITVGLALVGLIVAAICDLGFSRGVLGFCLACIFFIASAVCQVCFTISFRFLVDEEEASYAESVKKANTSMVFTTVRILFFILGLFAFCLPIALLTLTELGPSWGLTFDSWLLCGALFTAVILLLSFCIYKLFIVKHLVARGIVYLTEDEEATLAESQRRLKRTAAVCLSVCAVLLVAHYVVSNVIDERSLVERQHYDDPDAFIQAVQSAYDAWYQEGYENAGPVVIDPEFLYPPYPSMKFGEIDGTVFYYCPQLYHSIVGIEQPADGVWDIVVTTQEAYNRAHSLYQTLRVLPTVLLAVNVLACVGWYVIAARKKKTT